MTFCKNDLLQKLYYAKMTYCKNDILQKWHIVNIKYCKKKKMKKWRWKKFYLAIIPIAKKKRQSLLPCTVLYCTVLYCTVLYCTVLYCTVLYCTVLYCTVLYWTVLYLYMKSKLKELQCHKAVPVILHKFLSKSLCCIMNEYISHFNKLRALS